MLRCSIIALVVAAANTAPADEYTATGVTEAPTAGELARPIADTLATQGVKVMKDASRTVCTIWPAKVWPIKAGFKPSTEVLYPFETGQFLGVIKFRRKTGEFRDQDLRSGYYTIRYGQQPVDGNHVGTSPTRDFFLLLPAELDKSTAVMDEKEMFKLSAKAAGSSHPAMLCMQKAAGKPGKPTVRKHASEDWYILSFTGKAQEKGKDKLSDLPVDVIVVGQAHE